MSKDRDPRSFHLDRFGHRLEESLDEELEFHLRAREGKLVESGMTPDQAREEAVVLVGHGTDHCIWTAYPAFYQRLRERYGRRAFGGMIEDGYPDRETLIDAIVKEGFKRVRLVPFMLVSGVHFEEDLAGEKDSWKSACEARGLSVTLETRGLGE